MTYRNVAPPRRRPKRVLVVRMLVAKLAWLEARPHWREGRVVWEGSGGKLAPEAEDLSRAQRVLTRLQSYPFASREALGDSDRWLRDRRARLEKAKQLRGLAADLPALARQAHGGDGMAVQRLVALLSAEALCANSLPVSPSAALLGCGARAEAPLRDLLNTDTAPREGRALAALTLGAIHRGSDGPRSSLSLPEEPCLRRAYRWGSASGLDGYPALAIGLLADEEGFALAGRATRALAHPGPFCLPVELLRELLDRGAPASRVVALAEAARLADALAEQMLQRREELPDRASPQRRAVAERLSGERQQAVAQLAELLQAYARATGDPTVLRRAIQFAQAMLHLDRLSPELAEAIARPLRRSLDLPPHQLDNWLAILVERHGAFWDLSTLADGKQTRRGEPRVGVWLEERWTEDVRPALMLLQATGDPECVREALDRRLHRVLSNHQWEDPERYRLVLALSREVCVDGAQGLVWSLCWVVSRLPDAATARALLQPLAQAMIGAPVKDRLHLLEQLLDDLPDTRQELRTALPRLVRYVPRLLQFAGEPHGSGCVCGTAVRAALRLDGAVPEQAEVWLDWMLSHLAELSGPDESRYMTWSVRLGVSIAVMLAQGEFRRFKELFRAAIQHEFSQDEWHVERGLALLPRFPGLGAPLSQLFPHQPQRCADLLVRLGLTSRLGPEVLAPLKELEIEEPGGEGAAAPDDESDWAELLQLAPGLAAMAAAYRRAQRLLGAAAGPPPGVRRAIEQPRRLARELEYLERRLAAEPGRDNLSARAGSLRQRLADPEALHRAVRLEAAERLEQVTAVAQLAAAEQQVLACYRERLAAVVGPLPPGLRVDDDLLNATLLTVDIDQNRRLLLRMLRAHLAGERQWREQHPANAAFLQSLAARGVDREAWLAAHPRRYPCAGASGGRVHLRLERDPLRILQMGNYFDTCLSFGGCNSFSTVANACELNKRVVYATDGAGHVVGRKLIAINTEGGLVGFRTYGSLPDDESNQALRAIFRHYLEGFAARCRLPLSDGGTVPLLFAQGWYNDGSVAWDGEEESGIGGHGSGRRPDRLPSIP